VDQIIIGLGGSARPMMAALEWQERLGFDFLLENKNHVLSERSAKTHEDRKAKRLVSTEITAAADVRNPFAGRKRSNASVRPAEGREWTIRFDKLEAALTKLADVVAKTFRKIFATNTAQARPVDSVLGL
jgi:glycerate kinase